MIVTKFFFFWKILAKIFQHFFVTKINFRNEIKNKNRKRKRKKSKMNKSKAKVKRSKAKKSRTKKNENLKRKNWAKFLLNSKQFKIILICSFILIYFFWISNEICVQIVLFIVYKWLVIFDNVCFNFVFCFDFTKVFVNNHFIHFLNFTNVLIKIEIKIDFFEIWVGVVFSETWIEIDFFEIWVEVNFSEIEIEIDIEIKVTKFLKNIYADLKLKKTILSFEFFINNLCNFKFLSRCFLIVNFLRLKICFFCLKLIYHFTFHVI